MRKILIIAAITAALSATASFATGTVEVRSRPSDQAGPDQQSVDMHMSYQIMIDQQRVDWQRNQWQNDQSMRHDRRQSPQTYDEWLASHRRDYDNRPNPSPQQSYEAYVRSQQGLQRDQVRPGRQVGPQQDVDRRRAYQLMLDQQRADWQRNQWQYDQSMRHDRRQTAMTYDEWLALHRNDYDNRPNQSAQQSYEEYQRSQQGL